MKVMFAIAKMILFAIRLEWKTAASKCQWNYPQTKFDVMHKQNKSIIYQFISAILTPHIYHIRNERICEQQTKKNEKKQKIKKTVKSASLEYEVLGLYSFQ